MEIYKDRKESPHRNGYSKSQPMDIPQNIVEREIKLVGSNSYDSEELDQLMTWDEYLKERKMRNLGFR